MNYIHFVLPAAMAMLLLGCESNPSTPTVVAPATDPARAALAEGERAYNAGDDAKALAVFLPLAQNGNPSAQFRVARIYKRDKGVPVNEAQSCNWWEALANQSAPNAATAAVNFGLCFESGKGRAQSYPQAVLWYHKAADGGNAYGMHNLGLAYKYGRGAAQSFEAAADWFRKALAAKIEPGDNADTQRHLKRCENNIGAARGDPQAQYDMAIDLMNGHKPEVKDERRAMAMMREAATRGTSPEAWYIYGAWLHGGMGGVKYDLAQAAVWTKKAADSGHEAARIRYAGILACGIGVKKDLPAGERLLRQAIEAGSWLAMSDLSQWYMTGSCGFKKDAALSAEWRARADASQRSETERRLQQK